MIQIFHTRETRGCLVLLKKNDIWLPIGFCSAHFSSTLWMEESLPGSSHACSCHCSLTICWAGRGAEGRNSHLQMIQTMLSPSWKEQKILGQVRRHLLSYPKARGMRLTLTWVIEEWLKRNFSAGEGVEADSSGWSRFPGPPKCKKRKTVTETTAAAIHGGSHVECQQEMFSAVRELRISRAPRDANCNSR